MSEIKVITGASGKLKLKTTKSPKAKVAKKPAAKPVAIKMDSPKLSTVAGTASKATIYIDVDDEITAIIDKVQSSKGSIIALVLPKRASVMQSVVNMKLLKRTAEQSSKNLVLVTSEASLLPLAGMVGLHVAETPSSKPSIPPLPDQPSDEPESVDEPLEVTDNSGAPEPETADFDPDAAANTPVGELAGLSAAEPEEVIIDAPAADEAMTEKPAVVAVKKNKKLAVPNFDAFRLRMLLGVLLLALLITGWVFATRVMPRAAVTIETNSQVVKSNLNITLDAAAKTIDSENNIIPATAQTVQKTASQQGAATGQQNNGQKASGKVTLTNCSASGDTITVPAGTGLSSGGMTYITQASAVLDTSAFTSGGTCKSLSDTSSVVNVVALKAGASYNIAPSSFTLSIGGVTAKSSAAMAGGTDLIVKVISQSDIDTAKSKIAAQDAAQQKQELQASLKAKGLLPVPSTFIAGEPQVTTSAKVGDAAETVTVTAVTPYTMLGMQQADLQSLVVANVKKQIDNKKQKILDDGVAKAVFSQQAPGSPTSAVVAVKVQSVAGPEINVEQLKKQVAGKKAGDIKQLIGELPGVTEVQVKYSPFWVSSAPKDVQKITIDILKPTDVK